ncbi:LCP family protein [Nocardioides jejuensis]|nr:LCP family protein [Nocardioides jejuensis]
MSFLRRHKAMSALGGLIALLLLVTTGWVIYLNQQVGNIPHFHVPSLERPDRPDRVKGDGMNILLIGADDGHGADVRDMLASGHWTPGRMRSDTMMVWHLSADRKTSQLVSLPRDSWVPIPGYGTQKLNAAFSYGGPSLLTQTLEEDFNVFIDHIAIVDFDGFKGVTNALGGVTVSIDGSPETIKGEEALAYVRVRKTLPGGDFDRIRRQQNFLRAIVAKLKDNGTLLNPIKLTRLVHNLGGLIAVDDNLTTGTIRGLAIDIAKSRGGQVSYLTAPTHGTAMVGAASTVTLDIAQTTALFKAISNDDYAAYKAENTIDALPSPDSVH